MSARGSRRERAVNRFASVLAIQAGLCSAVVRADPQEAPWEFSLTGNHSLLRSADAKLDLLAGLRYTHIGTTLDWSFAASVDNLPARTGSVGQGVDLWDGIVGVRGRGEFGGRKWFFPYYLDAGAGTSKFTWQGMLGVGYAFGWGDLLLVYRYLSFEQGDEHPVEHLYFSGPALGATFHF